MQEQTSWLIGRAPCLKIAKDNEAALQLKLRKTHKSWFGRKTSQQINFLWSEFSYGLVVVLVALKDAFIDKLQISLWLSAQCCIDPVLQISAF